VFLLLASLCLWMIPKPHGRLDYMVSGAVATAVALAAGFTGLNWWNRGRKRSLLSSLPLIRIRVARRSDDVRDSGAWTDGRGSE
jgi:hypothetical protein